MGVKIRLNAEQTKKFKACFIDDARRIQADRQRAAREQLESQSDKESSA
ncbi:hypothetical protein ACJ2A9_21500 [Anaerobacillus sp. MEB173]